MSGPTAPLQPTSDGTDAAAMPVFATERRVLGLPASQWPAILAPISIGILALAVWEAIVRIKDRYRLCIPICGGQPGPIRTDSHPVE